MCFRLKSCCHFLKLRNHLLYALLSYGCALTTNNSPVLKICVNICCASLSLVCILNFAHLRANFYALNARRKPHMHALSLFQVSKD